MSSSSYYKDEPVSDCRLEDISTLLNLVSGSGRSSKPSPEKRQKIITQSQSPDVSTYATVDMLDQLKKQLEINVQNEVKLQVEQQLRIKEMEGHSEQIESLRRDLADDRDDRKETDQAFMESVDKLMQEIVQLGVKLLVLEERIEEVEKKSKDVKPPPPPPPLIMEAVPEPEEPVVTSSPPPLVDLTENEVVEMITDIQAKFIEFGESQATLPTKMTKMKEDMENNLFNEIFQVNLGISKLEDRIQLIEERKRLPSQSQPPPALLPLRRTNEKSEKEVVQMITDLSNEIQAKFGKMEESQTLIRKMVEDAHGKKGNQPECKFVLLRPIEPPVTVTTDLRPPLSLQRLELGTPPNYNSTPPPHPPPPQTDFGGIKIVSVTGQSQIGISPGTSGSLSRSTQQPNPNPAKHARDPVRQWHCLCGREFRRNQLLEKHIKYFSMKNWKWLCKRCGERFFLKSHLKAHRRTAHKKKPLPLSKDEGGQIASNVTPDPAVVEFISAGAYDIA